MNRNIEKIGQCFEGQKILHLKAGARVYLSNSIISQVYFVESGIIQLSKEYDDRNVNLYLVFNGDIFGYDGISSGDYHIHDAEIVSTQASIRSLALDKFKFEIENRGLVSEYEMIREERQRIIEMRYIRKIVCTSQEVVIKYIEELASRRGVQIGLEVLIPEIPTHDRMSKLLGLSRQTVTTTLRELKLKNLIHYNRRQMIIRNRNGKIDIENGIV